MWRATRWNNETSHVHHRAKKQEPSGRWSRNVTARTPSGDGIGTTTSGHSRYWDGPSKTPMYVLYTSPVCGLKKQPLRALFKYAAQHAWCSCSMSCQEFFFLLLFSVCFCTCVVGVCLTSFHPFWAAKQSPSYDLPEFSFSIFFLCLSFRKEFLIFPPLPVLLLIANIHEYWGRK